MNKGRMVGQRREEGKKSLKEPVHGAKMLPSCLKRKRSRHSRDNRFELAISGPLLYAHTNLFRVHLELVGMEEMHARPLLI